MSIFEYEKVYEVGYYSIKLGLNKSQMKKNNQQAWFNIDRNSMAEFLRRNRRKMTLVSKG